MDFHRIPAERLRDHILKVLIEKEPLLKDADIEELKQHITFDSMDNIASDSSEDEPEPVDEHVDEPVDEDEPEPEPEIQVKDEVFSDTIQDSPDVDAPKPKKEKKKKKEKKEKKAKDSSGDDDDKPKKLTGFIYFKSCPDEETSNLIEQVNLQINPDTDEPYNNKVKAGGAAWRTLTQEIKDEWKQRATKSYEEKLKLYEESKQVTRENTSPTHSLS